MVFHKVLDLDHSYLCFYLLTQRNIVEQQENTFTAMPMTLSYVY